MHPVIEKIEKMSAAQQYERPYEMVTMRKLMGARNQNGSIALYAFNDMAATHEVLYYLEEAAKKPSYDVETVKKLACDWLFFIADRIPRYYNFHVTSDLTFEVIEALKNSKDQEEIYAILHAIQHYYAHFFYWLDVEIPWAELGKIYAEVKGDPVPNE